MSDLVSRLVSSVRDQAEGDLVTAACGRLEPRRSKASLGCGAPSARSSPLEGGLGTAACGLEPRRYKRNLEPRHAVRSNLAARRRACNGGAQSARASSPLQGELGTAARRRLEPRRTKTSLEPRHAVRSNLAAPRRVWNGGAQSARASSRLEGGIANGGTRPARTSSLGAGLGRRRWRRRGRRGA
jgi:hypothetical protein